MQNIIRYGDDGPQPTMVNTDDKPSFGIVLVSENEGSLSVATGNFVTDEEANELSEKLTILSQYDSDTLRSLYREKLRQPVDQGSKGALLG